MVSINAVRAGSTYPLIVCTSILLIFACTYSSSNASEFEEVSEVNLEAVPDRTTLRIADVAIGRGGIVYICDRERKQVFRVFTQANEAEVIRPKAVEKEEFWGPCAIAVGKEGMMYVVGKNEVWIFDVSGRVVSRFDTEIANPTSIAATDDGTTYIAGYNQGYVLYRYNREGGAIRVLGRRDRDVRVMIGSPSGGMVRSWDRGIIFGAGEPYEIVALGNDGNVIKRQLRPELDLGPKIEFEQSATTMRYQISPSGIGLSIATNDSLIYYCFSLKDSGLYTEISRVYVDVYDRNLNPIARDINIDGVILSAHRDGYVYYTMKNDRGMDGLFRGKLKRRWIE